MQNERGIYYELPVVQGDPEDPPCDKCPAICCHYFALEIDKPKSKTAFDQIRWYLLHEKTHVFIDEGSWFVQIWNPCNHLQPDNRCGIYETRPEICREYGTDEDGAVNCHGVSSDNEEYDVLLTSPEELDEYYKKWHKKRYGKKKSKKKLKKQELA
ncbi:MAG: YkgJ family cysteine cluster protein, partial [Candidatus Omnitrophica bacterium]|nr:YkgJ family cysteine cluster protein [Candidatus Omnitrophota bacterium]